MRYFLLLLYSLSMTSVSAQDGVKPAGLVENADEAFGRLYNYVTGQSCKEASRQELEMVDCQIENYSAIDSTTKKGYDELIDIMVFTEAAREAYEMNKCQADFFNAHVNNPAEKKDLEDHSFERYKVIHEKLQQNQTKITNAGKDAVLEFGMTPAFGPGEVLNAQIAIDERLNQQTKDPLKNIEELVSSIPLGNRPEMRRFLLQSAKNPIDEKAFKKGYGKVVKTLQGQANKSYDFFKSISYPDPGPGKGLFFNVDRRLKRSMIKNGLVQNVLIKNKLEAALEQGLVCRNIRDYETGPKVRMGAELLGSVVIPYAAASFAFRSALAASRVGVAAKSTQVASGYLSTSVLFGGTSLVLIDLKNTCFNPEYLASKESESCNPAKQLYEIKAEADIAGCLLSASLGVAMPIAVGISARAGTKLDQVSEQTAEIVVTGRRPKTSNRSYSVESITKKQKSQIMANNDFKQAIDSLPPQDQEDALSIMAILRHQHVPPLSDKAVLDKFNDLTKKECSL